MYYFLFLMLLLRSFQSFASYPEFFGATPESSSMGGQTSGNLNDTGNNYYAPSLTGFSEGFHLFSGITRLSSDFLPINNVTTKNNLTKGEVATGDISTNYDPINIGIFHLIIPIQKNDGAKLNISFYTPIGVLSENDTGDPFKTEYVMHRSRYNRSLIYSHLTMPFNDSFALSFGGFLSYQASSRVDARQSLSGSTNGSSGRFVTEIKPALAAIISAGLKINEHLFYLTYHQEMISEFVVDMEGEVTNPTVIFDNTIDITMYYDPHIFRLGSVFKFSNFSISTSFDYQLWKNYRTPIPIIKNNGGGLQASDDLEVIKTRNILLPKLGIKYQFTDYFSLASGVSYRPTPLDSNFSGAGNSVDTNSTIFSLGASSHFQVFNKPVNFGISYQYHKLETKNVVKTSGQEDGSSGNKIGSPSYEIGGTIQAISTGIGIKF